MSFREMLTKRQQAVNSLVCVGLDPEMAKLPSVIKADFGSTGKAIVEWMKEIVFVTAPYACMFKPNIAFWEDIPDGLDALREVVRYITTNFPDIPVFMDCKRGDIANTQKHYGSAMFKGFGVHGMNFSPYMGQDTMKALVPKDNPGVALVGLCYTSNPDARQIQDVILSDGRAFWEFIAQSTLKWAEELGVIADAGLVMAAAFAKKGSDTIISQHLSRCREIVGNKMWFLIPGIGAQGGFIEQTVKSAFSGPGSITINSSSNIIFASSENGFGLAATAKAEELRDQIRVAGGNC